MIELHEMRVVEYDSHNEVIVSFGDTLRVQVSLSKRKNPDMLDWDRIVKWILAAYHVAPWHKGKEE